MTNTTSASPALIRAAVTRFGSALACLILMLFVPAGTWDYWQAWLYLAVVFIPLVFAGTYLLRHSPDLIERRLKMRERDPEQKRIIAWAWVYFLAFLLLPGFDRRFGWSDVPVWLVLAADASVLVGYAIIVLAFRENRYAARIVQVEAEQTVISTGPYAIVRHPMYFGTFLFYLPTPIALGSYWAALFALPVVWTLVQRIRSEERILSRDLEGYAAYTERVRYRLVPGVW